MEFHIKVYAKRGGAYVSADRNPSSSDCFASGVTSTIMDGIQPHPPHLPNPFATCHIGIMTKKLGEPDAGWTTIGSLLGFA